MAFTLAAGFYDNLTKESEFSVVLLGLENSGKTTFLERLKTSHSKRRGLKPDQIIPTIGLNIGKLSNISGHRLFVCDIGGQLRSLWAAYYTDCHGIIFLIDSSDKEKLNNSLETFANVVKHTELEHVPILVLANKQDAEDRLAMNDLLDQFRGVVMNDIEDRACRLQPLSALQGEGVEEAINWLVQHMEYNQTIKPKRPVE